MTYVISSNKGQDVGGKARALFALKNFPVPPFFVLDPRAYGLDKEQLHQELKQALKALCPNGEKVAVRSSALDEDGSSFSFAGQFESYLFVAPEEVPEKVLLVWQSAFSERVLAYRRENELQPSKPPAVLIQRMVDADAAGVAFGADPVSGRRGIALVSAVFGVGESLVSGERDADTYEIDRQGEITKRAIAEKNPALTDDQVKRVAKLVRRSGEFFGRPQDIEFAYEKNILYLLQSRPITSLAHMKDPDGNTVLWDNSNITESYGGVTTPLTFSFARRIYEEVYRQLARILGVPEKAVLGNEDSFKRMLGLVQGRVYYNLLSWYRTLALLPGFTFSSRYMEQMMGVKEGLPEEFLKKLKNISLGDRLQDGWGLLKTILGLIRSCAGLPRAIERFNRRLDSALAPIDLPSKRPDELAKYYHHLEAELLTRWDAPLVNDLFAMAFFGVLRKLVEKWGGDPHGTLHNDLLSGEGGIVSAEPAKRISQMARLVARQEDFVRILNEASVEEIQESIEGHPEFKALYQSYLEKFSDRCLEELKLESPTLSDNPLLLLRAVGRSALHPNALKEAKPFDQEQRKLAERLIFKKLRFRPLRRMIFSWVLENARDRVRDRENLRFERTRLFGRVRRIFLETGKRFYALDLIEEPRDIFYLEIDEIFGFVDGTTTTKNLKGLVALRKAEFEGFRHSTPDDRFSTHGMVHQGNDFRDLKPAEIVEITGDSNKGLGCYPGIVRARVRVVTDPRDAVLESGCILVAERTDPGWIMLFPAASGLLVERGSLLSHSAIVAREMGIPAIVSIPGLTRWLKDGDEVEMDGATGAVRRVNSVVPHGQ